MRMAKKTKKEKILAEYHKKLYSLKIPQETSKVVVQRSFSNVTTPLLDYSYVLSDLRRISILTVLAICAQVVLWYVLRR